MKSFIVAIAVALVAATSAPGDAFARRLGSGGNAGMQRTMPAPAAPQAIPAKPAPAAQPTPAAAAAAPAVAPKRSWLGPIAGLAAGLGIAALMSHLGFGEGFGNIVMLLLLGVVAFVVIRLVMRRFSPASGNQGMQLAGAGAPFGDATAAPASFGGSGATTAAAAALPIVGNTSHIPAGFDVAGFERIAKLIFIRMQAANDAGDLNDLRNFTTAEMFAVARLDLQDRGETKQVTDVVRVDAEVLDVASEAEREIVSVRFHGLIRETIDGPTEPFDEVWHLVKPADGSREWAIAGIQPMQAPLAQAA